MDKLIVEIENIVKICAKQIIDIKQEKIKIDNKEGIGNIVTQYDKKIQEELKVSNKKLHEGIVLTGNAPYYADMREKSLITLKNFAMIALDFRRFGSAVIELCNIACGRAELYFELKLQPWDFAAGMLIVEEAGGKVSQMNGEKMFFDKPTSIFASNNKEDYLKYL